MLNISYLATTCLHVWITQQLHATNQKEKLVSSAQIIKKPYKSKMRLNSSEKAFHVLYDEVIAEPNCQRAGEVVSKGAMTMHSITQKAAALLTPMLCKIPTKGSPCWGPPGRV